MNDELAALLAQWTVGHSDENGLWLICPRAGCTVDLDDRFSMPSINELVTAAAAHRCSPNIAPAW